MQTEFSIWKTNRTIYLTYLTEYSPEQLNHTPEGFNNNLIWNIAHVIVVQQRLVYGASNLQMNIPDGLFQEFKPGTKPQAYQPSERIDLFKKLLIAPIEQTIADYDSGLFKEYREFTTTKGFFLGNVQDAIAFNNYHEAMHLGSMLSLSKLLP